MALKEEERAIDPVGVSKVDVEQDQVNFARAQEIKGVRDRVGIANHFQVVVE